MSKYKKHEQLEMSVENPLELKSKARMLTIPKAAALVDGLTKFRIRQMCIKGELPHVKAGNKYLINENVLLEYIGENPHKR